MNREGVKASLLGHSERLFERAGDVLERVIDKLTELPVSDTDGLIGVMNQSFVMVLMPLLLSSLAIAPRHEEFNIILTPSLMRLLRVLDSLNVWLRDKHSGTSSIASFLDLECSVGLLLGVFVRPFVDFFRTASRETLTLETIFGQPSSKNCVTSKRFA